jgi:hypothetical protein
MTIWPGQAHWRCGACSSGRSRPVAAAVNPAGAATAAATPALEAPAEQQAPAPHNAHPTRTVRPTARPPPLAVPTAAIRRRATATSPRRAAAPPRLPQTALEARAGFPAAGFLAASSAATVGSAGFLAVGFPAARAGSAGFPAAGFRAVGFPVVGLPEPVLLPEAAADLRATAETAAVETSRSVRACAVAVRRRVNDDSLPATGLRSERRRMRSLSRTHGGDLRAACSGAIRASLRLAALPFL